MMRTLWPRTALWRWTLGGLAALVLATGCVSLEQKERELTFRAVKGEAGWYGGIPDGVQEFFLPVGEGPQAPKINAWWWPDAHPDAPVVYYLHGSRWNLTGHVRRMEQLRRFGFSVFAIDYRGFGKSDGDLPSEQMVYEDVRAGWAWLVQRQPDPTRRFVYGHSLGGAAAIDLAASFAAAPRGADPAGGGTPVPHARGLIVESTFTSLADAASALSFSWLPATLILTQKFDSIEKIGKVDVPVLLVHGTSDRLLPSRFSEALYRAARDPKKLLLIENGGHNNSMWMGDRQYQQALAELFGLSATPGGTARVSAFGAAPAAR